MSNMANNDFHKMANEIIQGGVTDSQSEIPEQAAAGQEAVQNTPAIDIIAEEMRKEGIEGEGSDAWHAEATQRVIDYLDPSEVAAMPAEQIAVELGVNMDEEFAAQLDSIEDPEQRLNIIFDAFVDSAGAPAEQGVQELTPEQEQEEDARDYE